MFRKLLLVAACAGAMVTASAATPVSEGVAPTLTVAKGTVMVSNGTQFVTAKPGQALKAGDRVMILPGASASLNYADGHSAALPTGSMVDISSPKATSFKTGAPALYSNVT